MKKRLHLVCGVLLVAAVGGLLWWWPWEPQEPAYEGKPLSYWLEIPTQQYPMLQSVWDNRVIYQRRRLTGPLTNALSDSKALPFLVRALKRDRWFGGAYYRKWLWPRLPASIKSHLPQPAGGQPVTRGNAAALLGGMGSIARPIIPALIRALKEDENPGVREYTAQALGDLGKGDQAAIAALTGALKDKDYSVRDAVTWALRQIDTVFATRELREDSNRDMRRRAAEALGHIGKGNTAASAALTEASLKDIDATVRIKAIVALFEIGKGDTTGIAALAKELSDKQPVVRYLAAQALGSLGREARMVTPAQKEGMAAIAALTEALKDKDESVRKMATNSLLQLGPEAAADAHSRQPNPCDAGA
jgi:HEAT repeat protein